MFGNKKGLVLAGLAAYAYYKYNKMSAQEKKDLKDGIKAKGQKLYEDYVPADIKKAFNPKAEEPVTEAGPYNF